MIKETCFVIGELEEFHEGELKVRYARRNRIRYIDELLNEFEMLNLADETEVPMELRGKVVEFLGEERHSVADRAVTETGISEYMEALYDVQDTLMVPFDDEMD